MKPRIWLKFHGEKLSVTDCARAIGVSSSCLWHRLQRGVPAAELFAPGYGPHKKQMAADMHTEEYQPLRKGPGPRPYRVLMEIVRRCGSPERAAVDPDGLTAEEYLKMSNANLQH